MAVVLLKMDCTQCEHLWFGSQQDKGHVINVKYFRKSTTSKVTVIYWKYEETEE